MRVRLKENTQGMRCERQTLLLEGPPEALVSEISYSYLTP